METFHHGRLRVSVDYIPGKASLILDPATMTHIYVKPRLDRSLRLGRVRAREGPWSKWPYDPDWGVTLKWAQLWDVPPQARPENRRQV